MKQELVAVQMLDVIRRSEWFHEKWPSIIAPTAVANIATNIAATIDWTWTSAMLPIIIFSISR